MIILIAIATIIVIALTVIILKRAKLLEAKVEYGIAPETGKVVEKSLSHVSDSVRRVSETVEGLGDNINNMVEPITNGVGDILHSVAGRIKIKQIEYDNLVNKSIALTEEIERLKNRQINITDLTAQLKLSLISINQKYPSIMRKALVTTSSEEIEYLGLYVAEYEVHLGVDLDDLQFQLAGNDCLRVYGLHKPIVIGIKNLTIESPIDEIRKSSKEKYFGLFSEKTEILKNHDKLSDCKDEHRNKILSEIQQSQSLEYIRNVNAHLALAFLNACLLRTGMRIEESIDQLTDSRSFVDICEEINRKHRKEIDLFRSEFAEVDSKTKQISHEILSLASSA